MKDLFLRRNNIQTPKQIIMSNTTAEQVFASPGKIDDILFPAEKILVIASEILRNVREEYVGDDGNWKAGFGFTEGIKLANMVISQVDRIGFEAFNKDFTPEIKNQIVTLVLGAIGIKYN